MPQTVKEKEYSEQPNACFSRIILYVEKTIQEYFREHFTASHQPAFRNRNFLYSLKKYGQNQFW